MDGSDPISLNSNLQNFVDFLSDLNDKFAFKESDSNFSLTLTINKSKNRHKIHIYSISIFITFLQSLSLVNMLDHFNSLLTNNDFILFKILDNGFKQEFFSSSIIFSSNDFTYENSNINREKIINKRNESVHLISSSNYYLLPQDFHLKSRSDCEDLNTIFDKLNYITLISFIANSIEFKNEELLFKIKGYKHIDFKFNYNSTEFNSLETLFKIYLWIYSEEQIEDKIGLTQNILSLNISINENKIDLDDNSYNSILSSYSVYLKENVESYIEIKNKISEFLLDLSIRVSDLVNSFANSLKTNSFLFFTYFISIFVFNALSSGKLKNIFTKDITYTAYALILISFMYLIASYYQSRIEQKRFIEQFKRIKGMYKDLLDDNDLDSIFNNELLTKDIEYH
ncbi:hypothetical protein [Bacillus sp. UNCCL81]|uniref:hypothetical protein n=1 Tax=Bacillus sp. UNCCL81 TaxID=1502755 RepID=UPI0008E102C7|nr:hypothetical protein [Bacillus sp. UNCCL81]SFC42296.1 hypothetical protein SAMN02799633_00756 [Bacillus sp. UNCCL81]